MNFCFKFHSLSNALNNKFIQPVSFYNLREKFTPWITNASIVSQCSFDEGKAIILKRMKILATYHQNMQQEMK